MLEMAGGEPASIGHHSARENEQTLELEKEAGSRVRRPLSSGEAADRPANNSRAARDFDGPRRGGDANASEGPANGYSRAASQQPASLALASHIALADAQSRLNAFANVEFPNGDVSGSTTGPVNASAYAEVYDELGAIETVGTEALFNRDSWRDSWKATPLLVILALERIAASNSRRAKREVAESAGRPRPHLPATADLSDPA
jgi:hypothetical protein